MQSSRRRTASRRGAMTVEMAICMPILVLLFFAAYEFSRVNMLRHTIDNAAYEGARRGIVPGATATDARNAAINILRIVGAADATVTVTPAAIVESTPTVTVSVSLPFAGHAYVTPMFFGSKTLTGTCTLNREKTSSSVP